MNATIAQVVVGLPVDGPFDYLVGPQLRDRLAVGQRVLVPFGPKERVGVVVGLLPESAIPRLKPVYRILDQVPALDAAALDLARAFAAYYGCSVGEAVEAALPVSLRRKTLLTADPLPSPAAPVRRPSPRRLVCRSQVDQPECWAWLLAQIRDVLQQGRGVIILVPEAAQVKAVSVRLAADVPEPVTILDRRLTAKKELAQWTAVREGRARLILGTRSAVFAPVRDLGLQVIIDEENRSYKQEQSPYYHAREVAEMRGRIEQALTIVVSPAPSAEVWYQVANGAAEAVEFPSAAAASRQAIDLANYKPRYKTILSFPVQSAIRASLERSGRVLLFLNRRGSSTATRCNQCGRAVTCPRCDVAMSYLEDPGHLVCHRCDGSQPLPRRCPHCQGEYLRPTGIGLETVAVEARRLYPEVRVAIFDRESASVPRSARIVVGTQAVLRALRPGEMDLAVVLDFDAELNRMDFRSEHHAFALLTRLARLAGRQLMAQTHQPEDYALRCALKMDWAGFYEQELRHRRESGLPPYQHLLELTVRGPDEAGAAAQIAALHRALLAVDQPGVEILDPQPDARAKLRDQYRFIIILRGSSVPDLHQLVRSARSKARLKRGLILTVNVDP